MFQQVTLASWIKILRTDFHLDKVQAPSYQFDNGWMVITSDRYFRSSLLEAYSKGRSYAMYEIDTPVVASRECSQGT